MTRSFCKSVKWYKSHIFSDLTQNIVELDIFVPPNSIAIFLLNTQNLNWSTSMYYYEKKTNTKQ